jgi:hypothetical protein
MSEEFSNDVELSSGSEPSETASTIAEGVLRESTVTGVELDR